MLRTLVGCEVIYYPSVVAEGKCRWYSDLDLGVGTWDLGLGLANGLASVCHHIRDVHFYFVTSVHIGAHRWSLFGSV